MDWGEGGEWMVADFNRNPELFPPIPRPLPPQGGKG